MYVIVCMIVIWGKNNSRVFLFKMMHFSILHTQRRRLWVILKMKF